MSPSEKLARIVGETPARPLFRLQFLGLAADRGPSILKEVDMRASDASEAARDAAPRLATSGTGVPPDRSGGARDLTLAFVPIKLLVFAPGLRDGIVGFFELLESLRGATNKVLEAQDMICPGRA